MEPSAVEGPGPYVQAKLSVEARASKPLLADPHGVVADHTALNFRVDRSDPAARGAANVVD